MDFRATKALPIVTECGDSQRRRRRAHSFSSSLLDAICQSMELDEDDHHRGSQRHFDDGPVSSHNHLKVKISKQQRTKPSDHTEFVALQSKQVTSFRQEKKPNEGRRHAQCPSSSSISNFSYSESSSTLGPLSTSCSSYGGYSSTSSSSCFSTCSKKSREDRMSSMKDKMTKATMRAIKFCRELKNARSNPISPRCRLATYLNSLFNNSKKQHNKTSPPKPVPAVVVVAPPKQETYSSKASSQSQIVKPPYSDEAGPMERREVFVRCREKIVRGLKMREFIESAKMDEEEEDDDAESYASSDLFELETLIVGAGEELPVFETTDIKINRAIANAFSM
ncbi:unnamed protein product [Rhodiola kirilowii]